MEPIESKQLNNARDISLFKKMKEEMVAKNETSWSDPYGGYHRTTRRLKDYSLKEVDEIINGTSLLNKQKLSYNYFLKDGFYKKLIIYYATLLKYTGIVLPTPSYGQSLSKPYIQKKYFNAVKFVDNISLKNLFVNFSIHALVDGCYYGIIQKIDKDQLIMFDLPNQYCCSRFKDLEGRDIIEFDVSYFNTISEDLRRDVLALYPKEVANFYKKNKTGWVRIPSDIGVCFSLFDDTIPPLITVIPSTIQYDSAVEVERERDLEEIRKIIVQHVPHLTSTGELVFEPPEAEVMHSGAVGMLKGNKNLSVLTTYADVEAITSKTSSEASSNNLEKMMQNIYYEAGVSSQIFSPTGNLAIDTSIKNDMAMMMVLANKYARFVTDILNFNFSNSNISFRYKILPISYYNEDTFIDESFKLAQSGYSFLLPALAMDISQQDLSNLKDLENDILKLGEKLLPLSSAYTQGNGSDVDTSVGGAPEKKTEDQSPKTVENKTSVDNTGGSE